MERTQVLIAGAGPVGTVAAYYLAQMEVDVVIMEAAVSCEEDLRASTLHAPTLTMLAELGIEEQLEQQGLRAPVYQYRIRKTGETLSFDLGELKGETDFPYRLQCEQYKLARLLAAALERHPHADLRFSHRVTAFEQDESGVTVAVETPYAIEKLRADYLIAADGANSIVRKWLGVEFAGFTYPEKFLTLSTTYPLEEHLPGLSHVNYLADPQEWLVLLRAPSAWRVLAPIAREAADAELLADQEKNRIFAGIVPDGAAVETRHRTIYRVHQRVAARFNHGRTLLVGDAAHLNNPLGGFGMNCGIHDAWNLCEKLTQALKNGADAAPLLARFDRQRRAATHDFIQAQTMRNKKLMEEGGEKHLQEEWQSLQRTHRDPALRRQFLLRQSMIQSLRDAEAIH